MIITTNKENAYALESRPVTFLRVPFTEQRGTVQEATRSTCVRGEDDNTTQKNSSR